MHSVRHSCTNEVPKQPNAHDCGVFLLHFAELFVERIVNSSDSLVYNEKEWGIDRLIDYRTRMKSVLLENIEILHNT